MRRDQVAVIIPKQTWENFCAMFANDQRWWAWPWTADTFEGIDLSRRPEGCGAEYLAKDTPDVLRKVLQSLGLQANRLMTADQRAEVLRRDGGLKYAVKDVKP